MNEIFAGMGQFVVRFRWLILIAWVTGAVAAGLFLPSLASVTQSDDANFLPASAPSQHAARLAAPLQGAHLNSVTVLVARRGGPLTGADDAATGRLVQMLGRVTDVRLVRDVALSPDGRAEQIRVFVRLATSGTDATRAEAKLVKGMRSAISREGLPTGLQAHLAGAIAARVDSNTTSAHTSGRVQDLSLLFVIILLAIVFRSVLAPFIAVGPALLVVLTAGRLAAEVALHGLQVSVIASLLLIVLVLGAGTDYALFLMFRVREEIRGGLDPPAAVVRAVARVGEPIVFSAGTVIAAVLSLLAATFSLYSGLAVPLAIGIGLMLAAGLTLVPALLAILGAVAFWPVGLGSGAAGSGWWGRIAVRAVRSPVLTLGAGIAVLGALAVASTGYVAGGFGGAVTPPPGSDSAVGNAMLGKYFPRSALNATVLVFRLPRQAWAESSALAAAQYRLKADPQFVSVSGPLDPNGTTLTPGEYARLHARFGSASRLRPTTPTREARDPSAYQAYRASAQYVSANGLTFEFATTLAAGPPGTTAAAQAVPVMRADARRAAATLGATAFGVLGQAPSSYDIGNISNSDLHAVIPIAVVVIAVLLALVMRSLVTPLYLIASVVLSYFAALGLTVLVFMKISGQPGLAFILPFLMFVFLLALGEDYNILVMTRIREENRDLPLRTAVARALATTGTTVTSAGLVLAGTFGVLALGGGAGPNGSMIIDVGVGLALGVLMDTFLVRTLLVPAIVVLLGRVNWWPSRAKTAVIRLPGDHEAAWKGP